MTSANENRTSLTQFDSSVRLASEAVTAMQKYCSWPLVAFLLLHSCAVQSHMSRGCDKSEWGTLHSGNHTISVADGFGTVQRRFLLQMPDVRRDTPAPLVLGFHGQGYSPETWGPAPYMTNLARQHGWVIAYPAGLREVTVGGGSDVTWNVGARIDPSHSLSRVSCTSRGSDPAFWRRKHRC